MLNRTHTFSKAIDDSAEMKEYFGMSHPHEIRFGELTQRCSSAENRSLVEGILVLERNLEFMYGNL